MSNFITNSEEKDLSKRLNELIQSSEELKFLVGFFYFSGLKELYLPLKNNPQVKIKILVGLNIDKHIDQIIEFSDLEEFKGTLSNEEIVQKYFQSIKKSINSDYFDRQFFYEQAEFFIDLIKKDRLIIRKTIKPNHSKIYFFNLQKNQVGRNKLFITGSSNLTKSGLSTQDEFNVEISDYGTEETEKYFDNLWENNSLLITEKNDKKIKLVNLLEDETLIKKITPFEAFALALKIYLESFEKKELDKGIEEIFKKNGYRPYLYQLDAIKQALAVIEKYNGVILADVVGLGKTIIACSIARQLKKRGVIICPPGLLGNPRKKDSGWHMYKEQFGIHDWEVWSCGDLENLENFIREKGKDIEVVIIDEAHRFRNEDTKSFENLKNICRHKIVILLTATPFNNRPNDILALLKLFTLPKKSSITLDDNLEAKFKKFKSLFENLAYIKKYIQSNNEKKRIKAEKIYKSIFDEDFQPTANLKMVDKSLKYLAKQIRDIVSFLTIRRNRLDLQENPDYKKEAQDLSKVADPIEWFFDLTKEQSQYYDKVIGYYFADPEDDGVFKGSIYQPFVYEGKADDDEESLAKEENTEFLQQKNLYDFMRRLLVKRFESSFGAFAKSIQNFKQITETVKQFIEKTGKYILDRHLLERIYEKDEDEIEDYLNEYAEKLTKGVYPKSHKIYEISKFKDQEKFIADINADIKLFDTILKELSELKLLENDNDPKAKTLVEKIRKQLQKDPNRKIIIFSEYADTISYLEKILKNNFINKVLVINKDIASSLIEEINKNFDASYKKKENTYQILLTTDRISEGFNLNRAGMVINYDIPWNPVRVIQRLGRINRISKKVFDELYIINFFPTEKGAELVKAREIAQNKMFLIHNTLGEDAKIFNIDEQPSPSQLYQQIQQNPEKQEKENFFTKALKKFREIQKSYPDLVKSLDNFPSRLKVAKQSKENELLVFVKKNRLFILGKKYDQDKKNEPYEMTFEEAFEKIDCPVDEKRLEISKDFWTSYEQIKNLRAKLNPQSEQSLEIRARNNLYSLISTLNSDQASSLKKNIDLETIRKFTQTLLEDIDNYGTLIKYTLRRLAKLRFDNTNHLDESLSELEDIRQRLGDDYLEKEKQRQTNLKKEIILAIENQKL